MEFLRRLYATFTGSSTDTYFATAAPPMFEDAASWGALSCFPPRRPVSSSRQSLHGDRRGGGGGGAPIGLPFAFNPPRD